MTAFRMRLSSGFALHAVMLSMTLLLTACNHDMQDLREYVSKVKAQRPGGIGPMPEEKPYLAFTYPPENTLSPFDASALAANPVKTAAADGDTTLRPDPSHMPEFLESFPLDSLHMVGTLQQGKVIWALIATPDRTIQRVAKGNFVGQNHGKITMVEESRIDISELVPNGLGGFMRHEASIALSEQ
jgi:type IV pilus assembly protein PilP